MLWIRCPICGRRPIDEFSYGGELPVVPDHIMDADDRDIDYAWMYDNVAGEATERWFHHAGCRRWHTATRNTVTDTVL